MFKYLRIAFVAVLLLSIVLLAQDQIAWAENGTSQAPMIQQEIPLSHGKPPPGTVKPPPRVIKVCEDGDYSVGGVSTISIKHLARNYCVGAFLRKLSFALDHIPGGDGHLLADATAVRIYFRKFPLLALLSRNGTVNICYAVPPGKQAKIYRLEPTRRLLKFAWKPLGTTVKQGIACASAQISGTYALIGK